QERQVEHGPGWDLAGAIGRAELRRFYDTDLDRVDVLLGGRQGLAVPDVDLEVAAGPLCDIVPHLLDAGRDRPRVSPDRKIPGNLLCRARAGCHGGAGDYACQGQSVVAFHRDALYPVIVQVSGDSRSLGA